MAEGALTYGLSRIRDLIALMRPPTSNPLNCGMSQEAARIAMENLAMAAAVVASAALLSIVLLPAAASGVSLLPVSALLPCFAAYQLLW